MPQRKTDRRRKAPPQGEPLIVPVKQASATLGGLGVAKVKSLGKTDPPALDLVMVGPCYFVTTTSLKRFAATGDTRTKIPRAEPRKPVPTAPLPASDKSKAHRGGGNARLRPPAARPPRQATAAYGLLRA